MLISALHVMNAKNVSLRAIFGGKMHGCLTLVCLTADFCLPQWKQQKHVIRSSAPSAFKASKNFGLCSKPQGFECWFSWRFPGFPGVSWPIVRGETVIPIGSHQFKTLCQSSTAQRSTRRQAASAYQKCKKTTSACGFRRFALPTLLIIGPQVKQGDTLMLASAHLLRTFWIRFFLLVCAGCSC